jgi:hypothetical protein
MWQRHRCKREEEQSGFLEMDGDKLYINVSMDVTETVGNVPLAE